MLRLTPYVLQIVFTVALLLGLQETPVAQAQERETREVDDFTQVSVAVPGTLYLSQGETHRVEVEADADVLDRLETTVEGGELKIREERSSGWLSWLFGRRSSGAAFNIYVTAPSIEELSLAGSGEIVGETPIEGEALSLEIAGSGGIDLDVNGERLQGRMAGSGAMHLRGAVTEINTEIAGSGDIHAEDVEATRGEVSIMGSGDTYVHVQDRLAVNIMGSGDVWYRGSPEIETNIQGSGEVQPLD